MKNRLYDATKNRLGQSHVFHKGIMDAAYPDHGRTDVKFPNGNGRHHDGEQCGKCCNVSGFTCGFYQYACDPGVCSTCHRSGDHMLPLSGKRG